MDLLETVAEQGWRNLNARKKSLLHQLYLFSNGEKGKKGPHPKPRTRHPKPRKTTRRVPAPKASTKKSNIKKQTTSKYVNRKSPPFRANDYCGRRKKGNDGEWWVSKPDKNGVCRWQKFKPKK